jgi:hypothetical protein
MYKLWTPSEKIENTPLYITIKEHEKYRRALAPPVFFIEIAPLHTAFIVP